jgi:DNA-binding transcriptional ArsR family regulator
MDAYKQEAALVKAIGHPTRLRILDILSVGEACVCHLTTILKQRQPNVSQHLTVLREAGLVRDRKDGVIVYYRLSDPLIKDLLGLAREILGSSGVEVDFPPVPESPLPGCPCPKCGGAGACC